MRKSKKEEEKKQEVRLFFIRYISYVKIQTSFLYLRYTLKGWKDSVIESEWKKDTIDKHNVDATKAWD